MMVTGGYHVDLAERGLAASRPRGLAASRPRGLAASLPAIALISQQISIDAGLWAGIAVCAALVVRRPISRPPLLTALAFAAAVVLTSLALVTA